MVKEVTIPLEVSWIEKLEAELVVGTVPYSTNTYKEMREHFNITSSHVCSSEGKVRVLQFRCKSGDIYRYDSKSVRTNGSR